MASDAGVVLIVDDEEPIRRTLQAAIERALPGARVLTAGSGEEGLSLLRANEVDVILSDHKMAGMTGLAFLTTAHEVAADVPRVLMTAYATVDVAVDAANKAHAAHFLAKPFRIRDATKLVEELIHKRRHARTRAAAMERSRAIAAKLLGGA